jgi:uncharacterized protein YnzC (UPF0291/DUF896 family)
MEKVIALLAEVVRIFASLFNWVSDPKRWRRSVLDQVEQDKQEILRKVGDLTSGEKKDRDKARKELLKEIRE